MGSGLRGVRLWPAAGETRESGVPDRQTGTLETSFVMTARRDYPGKNSWPSLPALATIVLLGWADFAWPAKPEPFPHNRLTLKT
jgi:hypothetical protein